MGKKILVIEDNPDQATMLKARLKISGYEAVLAKDGEEGLAKATTEKPDLILLDILLPKIDGDKVCEQLRSNPATQNIPIIIITAISKDDLEKRNLVFGKADWMQKPYEPKDLLAKIKALIG